jgi:hypothetical protein
MLTGSIFEVLDVGVTPFHAFIIFKHNILLFQLYIYIPDHNASSPGLSLRLRLLESKAKPEPTASPCQSLAGLGLEKAQLSGLRA